MQLAATGAGRFIGANRVARRRATASHNLDVPRRHPNSGVRMKRAVILGLCLFLSGTALSVGGTKSTQSDDSFQSFWARFKMAVISRRRETVAELSRFPIGISSPAPNIKNRSELGQRFREVFVDRVNASECFARTEPSRDTETPEVYTVACRYDNGRDAAAYQFEHTKSGWRFTHFQLSTTCRCR